MLTRLRRWLMGSQQTRPLIVVRWSNGPVVVPKPDSPEFQQLVRDWLDGKTAALVLPSSVDVEVVPVPQ